MAARTAKTNERLYRAHLLEEQLRAVFHVKRQMGRELFLPANRALTCAAIEDSIAAGAQVVVPPELATSGDMFTSTAEARSAAITPQDDLFKKWAASAAAAAGSAVVIGGFCEPAPHGGVFNSAVMVDGTGVLAVYRKLHLWNAEKDILRPGGEAPPGGRDGVRPYRRDHLLRPGIS